MYIYARTASTGGGHVVGSANWHFTSGEVSVVTILVSINLSHN